MDPLLHTLLARGVLDAGAAEWTQSYAASRSRSIDTALLELDLVDEEDLLRGLESCFHLPAARPDDLRDLERCAKADLPAVLATSTSACPVRADDDLLVVLVTAPLADDVLQHLNERRVVQRVAPAHHVLWARSVVYGETVDEHSQSLEARLARRRNAPDVGTVLETLSSAPSLGVASTEALEFAAHFLDFACLLMTVGDEVRVLASRSLELAPRTSVPAPDAGCSFAAAVRFGGYYVGSLIGSDADIAFFDSLGRPPPRWAFVAPVPLVEGRTVVFLGDNGPRGIATRWIAKLTLVVSRLGQQAGRLGIRGTSRKSAVPSTSNAPDEPAPAAQGSDAHATAEPATAEPATAEPATAEAQATDLTAGELRAIARLRHAADADGVSVERFVDSLLKERGAPTEPDATALLGEVRGLFEQLASSLPSQLAQGIETAMRDLSPRELPAGTPKTSTPTPAQQSRPEAPSPELVPVTPASREVASYRSRRKKSARLKL
jgi:hypothetical protein